MKRGAGESETLDAVELHPLLRGDGPVVGDKKRAKKGPPEVSVASNTKDGFNVNPYYDPRSEMGGGWERERGPKKTLNLDQQLAVANHQEERTLLAVLDQRQREQAAEDEAYQQRVRQGLVVDTKRGEDGWVPMRPDWVEWWDQEYVGSRYPYQEGRLDMAKTTIGGPADEENPITIYVEHPVPVASEWTSKAAEEGRVYLTKKEKKRIRRNRRFEAMRDHQDRVKLGLEEAPKNKIKVKNMMSVLTNESIRNPTEVEARIRAEAQERERAHEEANAERKLTRDERQAKRQRKLDADRARGLFRNVYVVAQGYNKKARYKMEVNGDQMGVLGVCCVLGEKVLIIAEGGERAVDKYETVVMRRIGWTATKVWGGPIQEGKFHKWTVYDFDNDGALHQFLSQRALVAYYKALL